jgi:hypothetical protein
LKENFRDRDESPEDPDDSGAVLWRRHETVAIERETKLTIAFRWMNAHGVAIEQCGHAIEGLPCPGGMEICDVSPLTAKLTCRYILPRITIEQ